MGDEVIKINNQYFMKSHYNQMKKIFNKKYEKKETIIKINAENCDRKASNILKALDLKICLEGFHYWLSINKQKLKDWNGEVFIMIKNHKIVGYAYWNEFQKRIPCLRQLYIIPEERNKGHAIELLKLKIDTIEEFAMESPNYISQCIGAKYFKNKWKYVVNS